MKKALALILACCMAFAFAACSNGTSSVAPSTVESNTEPIDTQPTDPDVWEGEVSKVVMTYLTMGDTPADIQMVQDAVNEISVPKVGVEVEFKAVSAYDAMSQFPLWISGGEEMDLMMLLLQDVKTYADQGLIDPLNDLVANNAPYLADALEKYPLADGTYIEGQMYGVTPLTAGYGEGSGYILVQEYADAVGFVYDAEKIYTIEELTTVLTDIKEAFPDVYPNATIPAGSGHTAYTSLWGFADYLGANTATGALMSVDSTEVVNIYASPEYEAYVRTLREWNLAGLSYPDAATTSATNVELIASGAGAGFYMGGNPALNQDVGGKAIYQLQLSDAYVIAQPSIGSFWTIPITCKDPDAAMRFLNLTYADPAVGNLLQHGIEGVHYDVLDAEEGVIGFAEGVDANTSGYFNTLGLYGDRNYIYVYDANQAPSKLRAYAEKALNNKSPASGYAYNSENTLAQIMAIQTVLAEYVPSLETGSVDVDKVLPEFISRLEAAGINDVIADNQAQFDEFLGK